MTAFDWLGNDRHLREALTQACERLADAAPERCDIDPAWERLANLTDRRDRRS